MKHRDDRNALTNVEEKRRAKQMRKGIAKRNYFKFTEVVRIGLEGTSIKAHVDNLHPIPMEEISSFDAFFGFDP
jgi:hypothetical protein